MNSKQATTQIFILSEIQRGALQTHWDFNNPFLQDEDGMPLVTKIRDSAGQKGTGKWTAISALDHGMPVTLIAESVFAR